MQDIQSQLTGPTQLVEVRDSVIAAALRALDIPFFNPERPYTVLSYADGRRVPCWRFRGQSTDGKHITTKLAAAAASDPTAFIVANPEHPFSYALVGAMKAAQFLEGERTKRALVGFHLKGGKLMYVFEGSRKAEKLAAQGAKQI